MENNIYAINNENKSKPKRVLKLFELLSYWITIHFIIFVLFQKYLPSWTNPTFWLIYGLAGQIAEIILGWNIIPKWFNVSVFLWKFVMLLLGLMFIPYNMSYSAINFNLLVFLLYLVILKFGYNRSIFDVYIGIILSANYHNLNIKKFIKNRLRNLA